MQVTLVRPQIAPNTGNIGRLCVGFDLRLNLVGPLGFEINDRRLKRAGLDYWPHLEWSHYPDETAFRESIANQQVVLMSKKGEVSLDQIDLSSVDMLIFGSETTGLAPEWLQSGHTVAQIPFNPNVRSFNLANSVAMCVWQWRLQSDHSIQS